MYVVVSNNGTTTYKLSCVVCFKCFFISRCLLYQLWGFQTKVYKISGYYNVRTTRKEKLVLCENLVNSIPLRS